MHSLICVGCSVHHWVSCTINKVFRDCICVDTNLPCFEAIAYVLHHFDTNSRGDLCVLGIHLPNVC